MKGSRTVWHSLIWGGIFAGLSVLGGAIGSHLLKEKISTQALEQFQTGNQYLQMHAFALLITGLGAYLFPAGMWRRCFIFFLAGILLFCGSLFLISLKNLIGFSIPGIHFVTPMGGLAFIAGWVCFVVSIFKIRLS